VLIRYRRTELAFPHVHFLEERFLQEKPCIILHPNLHPSRQTIDSPEAFLRRSVLRVISLDQRTENSFALRARRNRISRPRLASVFKRTVFPLSIVRVLHFTRTIYVRPQLGVDHFRSGECRPPSGTPRGAFRGRPGRCGTKAERDRGERKKERGSQRETGTYHGGCGEAGSPLHPVARDATM